MKEFFIFLTFLLQFFYFKFFINFFYFNFRRNNDNQNSEMANSSWLYRYNRPGYVKNWILKEDEEIFAEHLENVERKAGKKTKKTSTIKKKFKKF